MLPAMRIFGFRHLVGVCVALLFTFVNRPILAWKTDLKEIVQLEGYLRQQLAANPDDFMTNLQLADGYRVLVLSERGTGASVSEMKQYNEAVAAYHKVIELYPKQPKKDPSTMHMVYLSLATLLHRNLQTEEAIHYHHKALEVGCWW